MADKSNDLKAYLVIAVLVIIGLLWFMADRQKNANAAPCGHDYVAQYGPKDCADYQQQQSQQSDYDCKLAPSC